MPNLGELPKVYDPKATEGKWYEFWLRKGYFTPQIDPRKKPFVIIMPPPNVTGELHVGHALTCTLEDILTRWHRMEGEPTLWLPGEDHASIATHWVIEQELAKRGLTRHDLGREKFLELAWEWTNKYRRIIRQQHQKLGASCDWTRERFTLDPGPSRAVRTTFVNLYNKGLIYRGERIINWCPRCLTALSDLEVEHKDISGHLWYIRYPLKEEGFIEVATTRPETLLGDTAVAVNPGDARYRSLLGKTALLPVLKREIPIIADEVVDPEFGTGAVKVTPAHDPTDFEIAQRHNLPLVNLMNPDATLNENAGPYQGMDRFACREALLRELKQQGLLVRTEPYTHAVGHCYRCNTVVEPMALKQWFVHMKELAQPAIRAVLNGEIEIIPKRFTKVYLNWMENIRDWCISRQLWWGHRIPVWYCQDCGELTVSVEDPSSCVHCGSPKLEQDPDILDTWFSSALWPHSTLGWPDDTEDFRYFYPTSVMETGYDILFFWVARMIMMGLENTGQVPFRKVYLHGLIRDEKGEKMSKSKGNVIDPIQAVEQYGADALRFALATGSSPGNDTRLSSGKLEGSRNFTNKLWNTARFVLSVLGEGKVEKPQPPLPTEDRWIRSRLNRLIAEVRQLLESFMLGEAASHIHDFLWGEFCDWYVEFSKIRLRQSIPPSPIPVLVHTLETTLRLLHPFIPFITEDIWQRLRPVLPEAPESIMIASYLLAQEVEVDLAAEEEMEAVIEVIRAIRNHRAEVKIPSSQFIPCFIRPKADGIPLSDYSLLIATLARAKPLTFLEGGERLEGAKVVVLREAELFFPAERLDQERERERLVAEAEFLRRQIQRLEERLADGEFLNKAPSSVVEKEKAKLEKYRDKLERLQQQLEVSGP
ncbi:MAG: valine--tRNA ligase [Chloroflexi bacterium]|nr:MAG: valine--tRNA ligase [Chloroflexota bacterium]